MSVCLALFILYVPEKLLATGVFAVQIVVGKIEMETVL